MAWMSGVATSGAMAGAGSDDVSPSARAALACLTVSIVVSGEPTNPASASLMAQLARSCEFGQVERRKRNARMVLTETMRSEERGVGKEGVSTGGNRGVAGE